MKYKIAALVLAGVLTVSFTACGTDKSQTGRADKSSTSETETGSAGGDEHTLSVMAWGHDSNIQALEEAAQDYAKHVDPDFKLRIIEKSSASEIETLVTDIGSDVSGRFAEQLSDLILFRDHAFGQYQKDFPDLWKSIDDADISWEDFDTDKLSYSTIDGVHYGVPVDNGTVIAAYRVDLLKQAGYTIQDLTGCSWKHFLDIGEKVYQKTGKYLLCVPADENDLVFSMMQAEGESLFKNEKPNLAGNKKLNQIIDILSEAQQRNVLYLADSQESYQKAIQNGKLAGVINSSWILSKLWQTDASGQWKITSLPTLQGNGTKGYASDGGSSLYMTSNCKNEKLAESFLSYTFGIDTSAYGPTARKSSVRKKLSAMAAKVPSVEQNDFYDSCRKEISQALTDILQNGAGKKNVLKTAEENLRYTMGLD